MYTPSLSILLFIFLSHLTSLAVSIPPLLTGSVLAPRTLHLCDDRGPMTIEAAGGFKSWGKDTPTQKRLFAHAAGGVKGRTGDPFISTTSNSDCGEHGRWHYTIDSSKIGNKIWDVNREYIDAGKKADNRFKHEMEQSLENEIPWSAVIAVAIAEKAGEDEAKLDAYGVMGWYPVSH